MWSNIFIVLLGTCIVIGHCDRIPIKGERERESGNTREHNLDTDLVLLKKTGSFSDCIELYM